ncbi:DUF2950 domain-containing protein [Cupriavidus necator]|uniref:DUF2950 domain-containing protein n=1 Tax=Cupriavidus necator (strain ATCC 17699 / DSM 428 / KCTC 22496 / NCIMB 10442 / H16 / Stanier 337) TaxID=381666 RepID=Q0KC58_CUPNH|nr:MULTISPECIES: DUF2950 domain-containing protein [Cupriavidus]EON21538.1 hypothetical protein C265_00100 [Cupriavidus sp. GA3-3]QCC00307.1 DUF2950 domain-containing protein [Cupriavidus necator H16]QQB76877.1 DUF2950 domain-containing protein [Cupriavidus necator]WKA42163.1 DUF2950 domain-containing protein [Cupriavidus necator]CAJ92413.1 conserved hypothetical protein [Cupriavidus necator H16]
MTSPLSLARSLPGRLACALALALALTVAGMHAAHAQKPFKTPEAAMNAFGEAVATSDDDAMKVLLGARFHDLIPPVGADIRYRFLEAWRISHAVKPEGDSHARIAVGNDGWTLPVPLVKTSKGWQFDTRAGVDEMRIRRIGRNELAVIQAMLAVYDAQREYARTDHDGDGLLAYAGKLASTPGKQDGLYWPTSDGAPPSPLGAAFLTAGQRNPGQGGYYGYHYKLLTAQGPNAPGGAYNYVVNGKLFGGFAVLAWPVRYGDTGVKSFMVSHDGQVYERDLGPDSAGKAAATKTFDPGPGWSKVTP